MISRDTKRFGCRDLKANLDHPVQPASVDHVVRLDHQALTDHTDHRASKVRLAWTGLRVTGVNLVWTARRDTLVYLGCRVCWALLEDMEKGACLDPWGHLARMARLDREVCLCFVCR